MITSIINLNLSLKGSNDVKIKFGDTVAETGIGIYPHAFMMYQENGYIEVYFRGKFVCKYPMNDVIKSNLRNVILNDCEKTEYYVKDGKVYSYSHVKETTNLIIDDVT